MPVRVDQAGNDRPPAPVEAEPGPLRLALAGAVQLLHPPVVPDQHGGEADDVPASVEGVAVDVVDQHVGRGGGKGEERGEGRRQGSKAHAVRDKACFAGKPDAPTEDGERRRPPHGNRVARFVVGLYPCCSHLRSDRNEEQLQ